jgi:hypothetical protein
MSADPSTNAFLEIQSKPDSFIGSAAYSTIHRRFSSPSFMPLLTVEKILADLLASLSLGKSGGEKCYCLV